MKNATSTIQGFVWQFRHDHVMRRRMLFVLMALSLVVGLSVFYGLRHTALTLAGTADCGLAEHVHSAECVQQTLICGLEEEAAEAAEGAKGAETAEGASENAGDAAPTGHTHSDACYETTYTCGFAADYEHVHTIECYADELADVETADVWEATLEPTRSQLSGTWAADVVAIAQTQLGYAESTRNWQLDEAGARQGYTRFGAWYGSPYVEWSSAFASFALAYAGIGEDVVPYGSGAHSWAVELDNDGLYTQAADHIPQTGDVVFVDTDADDQADRTGIVEAVAADGALTTIEGDVDGVVAEVAYPADATVAGRTDEVGEPLATVLGYLPTSEVQAAYDEYQQEQAAEEDSSDDPVTNPNDGISLAVSSAFDTSVAYQAWRTQTGTDAVGTRMLFAKKSGDADSEGFVVYCYNMNKKLPTDSPTVWGYTSPYYKASDASEDTFTAEAEGESAYSSEWIADSSGTKTLKHTILSIVYNGYPTDKSDLLSSSSTITNSSGNNIYTLWANLSNKSAYNNDINQFFYRATQLAIWHFTDGLNYSSITGESAAVSAAQIIYQAAVARQAPSTYQLDLFSTDTTDGGTEYQDLLAATALDSDASDVEASVQIQATKTLSNGILTADQFSFELYTKDSSGNKTVIETKTNDANGNVTFSAITYTEPGIYTYYVKEAVPSPADSNVNYDTDEEKVTVVVTKEYAGTKTTISTLDNATITGYESYSSGSYSDNHRTVTIDGSPQRAYCINEGYGTANSDYSYYADPVNARLADAVAQNNYGDNLADNMKKVLYYFSLYPSGTLAGYSYTSTGTDADQVVWLLSGNSTSDDEKYTAMLNAILASSVTPPSSYRLILLTGEDEAETGVRQQPLVTGYSASSVTTTTVESDSMSATVSGTPAFENSYLSTPVGDVSFQITATKVFTDGTLVGGDFEFVLLDENGNQIGDPVRNDANGNVTFPAITKPAAAATYTYYVKETSSGDSTITYDNEPHRVTVTVSEGSGTTTVTQWENQTITGYEAGKDLNTTSSRAVIVNGNTYRAYCINSGGGEANSEYAYIVDPTSSQIEPYIIQNYYSGDELSDTLKKVLYYFSMNAAGTSLTYTSPNSGLEVSVPLYEANRDGIVSYIVGEGRSSGSTANQTYAAQIEAMKQWSESQSGYESFHLVLFSGNDSSAGNQQPLISGFSESSTFTVQTTSAGEYAATFTSPTIENTKNEEGSYSATIMAKKTIDGADVTDGKTFTFLLQEDLGDGTFSTGEQATTDATTGIATWTLSYSTTGTHTYRITEVNTGDYATVNYNTEASETVTVEVVDNTALDEIETAIANGTAFSAKTTYGSKDSTIGDYADTYTVTPSGGSATQAYKLSTTKASPSTYGYSYSATVAPDTTTLASITSASEGDLKKLLYYFDHNSLTEATKIGLMLTLSNPSWSYASNFTTQLNSILQGTSVPSGYTLVLYEPSGGATYTPLIAGLSGGSVSVTYNGSTLTDTNLPTINNTTRAAYTMPETGGVGRTILYVVGGLLVAVPIAYIGYGLWRRRRKGGWDDG